MKKKFLALVLALTMALSLLPVTAMAATNVASVTLDGNTTEYATIDAAWNEAVEYSTTANKAIIKLLDNCEASDTLNMGAGDNIELDTAGCTLRTKSGSGVDGIVVTGGSFEVTGEGTIKGSIYGAFKRAVLTVKGGSVTVNGSTIHNEGSGNATAPAVYVAGGKFNFEAGILESASVYALYANAGTSCLYSGTIIGNGSACVAGAAATIAYSEYPLIIINKGNNENKLLSNSPPVPINCVMDIVYSESPDGSNPASRTNQTSIGVANSTATKYMEIQTKPTYTVTFDANGGEGTMAPQIFIADVAQNLTANAFTCNGYMFNGWNTKADGTGTSYSDNASTTVSTDTTLYAKWTENTYTVTFDANGHGTAPAAITGVTSGSTITAPSAPTADGYTFGGWYTDVNCTAAFDFTTAITGNITLYAKWTENAPTTYTVTFDANGHGTAPAAITGVTSGSTITAPSAPTADGYTFGGWYTDANCTAAFDFTTAITGNITLYAKWTQNAPAPQPPVYYPPVDPTPEVEKVETPKTADAGIFMAVSMSILSVTGSAVLLKKKED